MNKNRSFQNGRVLLIVIAVSTALIIISADSYISAGPNNICLACHEDMDLFMERGGKKISLYVDAGKYKRSAHSDLSCDGCHEGYNPDEIPHTKTPFKVNCTFCHEQPKELSVSVHPQMGCSDCHTKHDIKTAKEFSKEQTSSCLSCHKAKNIQKYKASIHSSKKIGCESCHSGGHKVKSIPENQVENVCGKCHGSHQRSFDNSIHRTVLKSGQKKAPTCSSCHGSHQIISARISIESETCLKCHLDEKMFPGENIGSAKFVSQYKTSIHASIEKDGKEAAMCSDCHGNHMIQTPDDPEASTSRRKIHETCGKCHKEIEQKFLSSAHGKSLLSKFVAAPTCVSCHSEHSIQAVKLSDDFSKLNQVDMCLRCHQEGKLPHKNYKGEEVLISNYKDSYHYRGLQEGKNNAATCADCHGSHEMNKYDDPKSKINKNNIAQTCGQANCHTKQLEEFSESIHEISLLTKEGSDAPTCTGCHGNHQILRKDEKSNRLSSARGLVQLCSDCHSSVELVEKYSIPSGKPQSYMDSFHGLAVRGGSKVAANCESCHGSHNIRPSTDSLSTISKKNLPKTCGSCHPGAVAAFFNTPIHITNPSEDTPVFYWITVFYAFFIFVLIGGMVAHNILDFRKKFKMKK